MKPSTVASNDFFLRVAIFMRNNYFWSMSRVFLLTILLLFASLVNSSCERSTTPRLTTILDDVESFINEYPDSALSVLRKLDNPESLHNPALRARASLLHSMALDKCYIDLQTDSILSPAIDWYRHHGSSDDRMKTYYYLGRLQYNAAQYQAAIVTFSEALEIDNKAVDLKYKGLINQAIADTYVETYQERESQPYLDKAYEFFCQIQDSSLAKRTLYKKAITLRSLRKWQEADSLLRPLLNDKALPTSIQADYALLRLFENNPEEECSTLFEQAIFKDGGLPSVNHWAAYAYALSREGKQEKASALYDQLNELFPENERTRFWRHRTEYDAGHYRNAYHLLQKSLEYQDSLLNDRLNKSAIAAQKEFFMNRAIQEQLMVEHRNIQIIFLLFILGITLLFGILLIKRIRQRARHEQARLAQTIETIEKQQQDNKQWEQHYRELFGDYFNTLGKICADYEEGRLDRKVGSGRTILRRIDRIVHNFTGNQESHEEFEKILNKHLNNIMKDFRVDYPKLKHKDYLLSSYVFAGIDMPTISVLMGDEIEPLYTRKSRIKATITKSSNPQKSRYLEYFHR